MRGQREKRQRLGEGGRVHKDGKSGKEQVHPALSRARWEDARGIHSRWHRHRRGSDREGFAIAAGDSTFLRASHLAATGGPSRPGEDTVLQQA